MVQLNPAAELKSIFNIVQVMSVNIIVVYMKERKETNAVFC